MTDADVDGSHIRTLLLTFFFRHMQELILRGHVYIAQPPLYKIKKGRFEQYIKDDRDFVKVMVKRAADGMTVTYGDVAAKLEGGALTRFMTTLNDYLGFLEKVTKKTRNERVAEMLPRIGFEKRTDFEGTENSVAPKVRELERALKGVLKEFNWRSVDVAFDAEHSTWGASYTDSQGATRKLDWDLAHSPEYRQMLSKYKQIEEYLKPPFLVEVIGKADKSKTETVGEEELPAETQLETETGSAVQKDVAQKMAKPRKGEPVEKQTARDLFEYVLSEGRREYQVQRYKGLGEMTSQQLWETTMNPEIRTLLQVKLDDIAETEKIFTTLMGEDVEARRKFIEDNALDVKNLDI